MAVFVGSISLETFCWGVIRAASSCGTEEDANGDAPKVVFGAPLAFSSSSILSDQGILRVGKVWPFTFKARLNGRLDWRFKDEPVSPYIDNPFKL